MNNAHIRTPVTVSLNKFATRKALEAINQTGRALPCTVTKVTKGTVTVSFDIIQPNVTLPSVTIPIMQFPYVTMPVQVGDKGYTSPAAAYVGGVSGLGGGSATLAQQANLANLIFTPIANANATPSDPDAVIIKGVNASGVIVSSGNGGCTLTLNNTGVVISIGMTSITINASGITVANGDIKADTISLKTHLTTEVTPGSGKSGPPSAT